MGSTYEFSCPDCGYKAEVSGERDCGFIAVTETRTCPHCREIMDVLVGDTSSLAGGGQPWSVAYPNGGIIEDLEQKRDRCPTCNRVLRGAWDGACPRCGARMERGYLTVLWD